MPELTREKRQTRSKLSTEMRAEVFASLTEIDWRLLFWLLRYPLQRADDLVIGVARWTSRATVYRHMQKLEMRGMVESVLPKTPGAGNGSTT
jgi:predicted transcriptional regulator